MAWQLIYTSAPRLLEAGRSGFGSVARHRQISPLLASAVERASQFSRQPGMDPGRVIFSHRIIPISGVRFHILSSIRDSGADYTGRTNHIAHHLIAEAREVAQLRSEGASPADVLLAMPWVERWDEPPRYLESTEDVRLADFTPQTGADGAHWAAATGTAAHAWLLAAGDASRGAYLIPPPGVDLRWLIADSLRLAPERLWQTSFTTSLQSKDEISDFRWVGLEPGSPLRNETAASGRPILDLRSPESLPQPEIPVAQLAHASNSVEDLVKVKLPMEAAIEATIEPLSKPTEEPPRRQMPARQNSDRRATVPQARPVAERIQWDEGFHVPSETSFHIPRWAWITAAAMVLAVCLVFFPLKPLADQINARNTLASALSRSEYFDEPARMKIAKFLLPKWLPHSESWERADASAEAINRLATALMKGKIEGIKPEDMKELRELTGNGAPDAITSLYGLLTAAQERNAWIPPLKSAGEAVGLQQSARDAVNNAIPRSPYENLNRALRESADVKIAKAEYDLLAGASILPNNNLATFQTSINSLKASMPENKEAMRFLIKAERLLELWKLTETASIHPGPVKIAALKRKLGDSRENRPEWLSKRIAALMRADGETFAPPLPPDVKDSPAIPAVPLYFASDTVALKSAQFPGLQKKLAYFVGSPFDGELRKLPNPGKEGNLWMVLADKAPAFVVNEAPPQIMPGAASVDLAIPFVLSGKDDTDKEVIRIYVGAPGDKPLFPPTRNSGLTRAANVMSIDFQRLALPGLIKAPLKLGLPNDCTAGGTSSAPLPLTTEGKTDIGGLLDELTKTLKAKKEEIANLKNTLALNKESARSDFAERKSLIIEASPLGAELRKKDNQVNRELGKESDPPFQQCGNLIVALTQHAQFAGAEELFKSGQSLAGAPEKAELAVINEKLSTASVSVAHALASMGDEMQQADAKRKAALTQEQRGAIEQEIDELTKRKKTYEPILLKLKDLIDSLLPETPRARAAREASESQLHGRITDDQRVIDQISANPLLDGPPDRVPPGTYRLLAQTEGGDHVLLLELKIER